MGCRISRSVSQEELDSSKSPIIEKVRNHCYKQSKSCSQGRNGVDTKAASVPLANGGNSHHLRSNCARSPCASPSTQKVNCSAGSTAGINSDNGSAICPSTFHAQSANCNALCPSTSPALPILTATAAKASPGKAERGRISNGAAVLLRRDTPTVGTLIPKYFDHANFAGGKQPTTNNSGQVSFAPCAKPISKIESVSQADFFRMLDEKINRGRRLCDNNSGSSDHEHDY